MTLSIVMAGLDPAIGSGTRPRYFAATDGRHKAGHDGFREVGR